jgi:[ribosomal protein S5]-alanine N-acetyltransferase
MIAETNRLILRELTPHDAPFAFELNNNPEVLKYTGDEPFESTEEARDFLENYSDYRRNGFGRWGVVLKGTGELIGWCGLKRDRETGEVDLGYRFFQDSWNKGYATEASVACLEIGKTKFGLEHLIARARKENPASYKVMEKLGFTFEKEYLKDGENWVLYAIDLSAK